MSIDVLEKIQVDTGITGLAEIPAEIVRTNLKFNHNYRKQINLRKNTGRPEDRPCVRVSSCSAQLAGED
jgi:hypothetical protein